MSKTGYLYIISNKSFPNWLKVGTTWNLKDRLKTYQTGDPYRSYKLEFYIHHPKFREAEKKIKELMIPFAKQIKNEWYEIDLTMAIPRLEESLLEYGYNNLEKLEV